MLRMRVRPEGFKRIRTKLEALQLSRGDLQGPVLRALDTEHCLQVRGAFTTHGAGVAGGPWPAWSPRYAAWRAKHGLGHRMMRLTDNLYGRSTSPRHGGHVARWLGRLRFAFGYVDDVGYWHQNAKPPRKKRSVIDKTARQYREFVTVFVDFYRKRVKQVLRHT